MPRVSLVPRTALKECVELANLNSQVTSEHCAKRYSSGATSIGPVFVTLSHVSWWMGGEQADRSEARTVALAALVNSCLHNHRQDYTAVEKSTEEFSELLHTFLLSIHGGSGVRIPHLR